MLRLAFDNSNNQLFGGEPYREGMYIRIQAPDLSVVEWHPFTISSAPGEEVPSQAIAFGVILVFFF